MTQGSINIKLRPIKLAFLVDPTDEVNLIKAIEINTFLWGGMFNPIIPVYKRKPKMWRDSTTVNLTIRDITKGYVDAYDPDYIVTVGKCFDHNVNTYSRQIFSAEEIFKGVEEDGTPQYGIGLFEILKHFSNKELKFHRRQPLNICLPDYEGKYSVFLSSVLGTLPSKINKTFDAKYLKIMGIQKKSCNVSDYLTFLSKDNIFLRRMSTLYIKCRPYFRALDRGRCIFFMDASQHLDIIDFWNLRAIGWHVIPIPKQAITSDKIREFTIDFIEKNYVPDIRNPDFYYYTTILKSRACTAKETQTFVRSLKIRSPIAPGKYKVIFQNWYPRIWDEWARNKDGVECCELEADTIEHDIIDYQGRINFRTLDPEFMQSFGGRGTPRYANEISLHMYGDKEIFAEVIPEGDNNLVRAIGGLDFSAWRFSKSGMVYLSSHSNWSVSIALPKAEYIFAEWLKSKKWHVDISVPGRCAKQIIKRLGGIYNISMLANEGIISLFKEMGENKVMNERYFRGEIKRIINQEKWRIEPNKLMQRLIEAQMFQLGLKIQCPVCKRYSWFSLGDVDYRIQCMQCHEWFSIPSHSPKEIEWSYRTVKPFGLPYQAHGVYSVLLTLRFFSYLLRGANTPIMSFEAVRNGEKIEADLGFFFKESPFERLKTELIFAECKTYDYFKKKDIVKMRFLGEQFPGSILVFATLNKSLTMKEQNLIRPMVNRVRRYWKNDRPRNPVLILTGIELFADWKPPQCWEKIGGKHTTFAKNYKARWFDFFQLCDLTQQLYLNMKPWHEWLKERFEKRLKTKKSIVRKTI